MYQQSTNDRSGLFKDIREKVNQYPLSRCSTTKKCIELVRASPKIAFGNVWLLRSAAVTKCTYTSFRFFITQLLPFLYDALQTEVKLNNGRCHLSVAREPFLLFYAVWILPKPHEYRAYVDAFSKGQVINECQTISISHTDFFANLCRLMEMREYGIYQKYCKDRFSMPPQCRTSSNFRANKLTHQRSRLSLRNLTSSFALLLLCYVLALLVYVAELVSFYILK